MERAPVAMTLPPAVSVADLSDATIRVDVHRVRIVFHRYSNVTPRLVSPVPSKFRVVRRKALSP